MPARLSHSGGDYDEIIFWNAESTVEYKNLNPAFSIFSELTVALFSTSILISPKTIFKTKDGTLTGIKNLFLSFANDKTNSLLETGFGATALYTPDNFSFSIA